MSNSAHPPSPRSSRQVLSVAWPLGLKAVMTHGLIAIDAYLVSPLGETALAAMGLAGSIGGLILGTLFAFSTATQIRVAQAYGSGNEVFIKSAFWLGLLINAIVGLVGLSLAVLYADDILRSFAHTPEIAAQAQAYLNIFLLIVVAEIGNQLLTSYFNGCGQTKTPFYSYLIIMPINVGLSLILIHGHFGLPAMGVAGAAVGSAVAAGIQALYLGSRLYVKNRAFKGVQGWRNDTFILSLKRHLVFALPLAATFFSVALTNNICTLMYAKLPVNQFAAKTLIMPWVHIAGTVGISWAQATGITVAQLLGERQQGSTLDAFLKHSWKGAAISAGIVSLIYLGIILASAVVYAGLQDETKATLWSFLPVLLLLPFPKTSNAMCGHSLRAGGDTVYVMNIFLSSQWLCKLPLTFAFIYWFEWSATLVFMIFLIEELFKFPLFHLRLLKGKWKEGPLDA
ncbi:MAG: polysaccharide biosynthesis C-terminal domain-containing protein [Cognatishimia sp.]|uniref:MATE family efflux transporter n=1 Tax=Cognatishimia sp. TaxID=2211648 RepID=UPI003B8C628B